MMDITGIVNQVVSHAASTGLFERVNTHEPKNAPGNGLTCAVWADQITPVAAASGLDATTGSVILNVRLYTSMLQQPYDAIDPNLVAAVDTLMSAYSGAFTLNGEVRNVDLLGAHGTQLSARAGYINQDGKVYRVMTIMLPLIINDLWLQAA
jgi:hypothetical protein